MSNIINLNLGVKSLSFSFGGFNLDYISNDKKDKELTIKAQELKERAEKLEDTGSDAENREVIKSLVDEVFEVMFDAKAPKKIYEAVGENTMNYLGVFLQISEAVQQEKAKQQNDEIFTKYLANNV